MTNHHTTTMEIQPYSPADIPRADSLTGTVVNDVNLDEIIEVGDALPETAIQELAVSDEIIRGHYSEAEETLERIAVDAEEHHSRVVEIAKKNQEEIQTALERELERAEHARQLAIASIERQYTQVVARARMNAEGDLADHDRIIEAADEVMKNSNKAIAFIKEQIAAGRDIHGAHAERRDKIIGYIEGLLKEYDELEQALATRHSELESLQEDYEDAQEREAELIEDENKFAKKERRLRKQLENNDPALKDFRSNLAIRDDDPHLPSEVKRALKKLKDNISSPELSVIISDRAEVVKKQRANANRIRGTLGLIEACNLEINRIHTRMGEIPALLDKAHDALRLEVAPSPEDIQASGRKTPADMETHSRKTIVAAEILKAVHANDITKIAGNVIPAIVQPVYSSMAELRAAYMNKSGETLTPEQMPEPPIFDETFLAPLLGEDQEPFNVSDVSGITENMERLDQEVGGIRSLIRPDFSLEVAIASVRHRAAVVYKRVTRQKSDSDQEG